MKFLFFLALTFSLLSTCAYAIVSGTRTSEEAWHKTAFIEPFQNEEDSFAIDELTIENRLDRVSVYGSVQLTRDKAGLRLARELKSAIDAVVVALEADKALPEHARLKLGERVDNPFK